MWHHKRSWQPVLIACSNSNRSFRSTGSGCVFISIEALFFPHFTIGLCFAVQNIHVYVTLTVTATFYWCWPVKSYGWKVHQSVWLQWPYSHYLCCKQCWRAAVILTQLNVQPSRAYLIQVPHQVWKIAVKDQGWHCARDGSVNVSHTYTLTQPETLGLIDNTLPNKKLETNVMDVHSILIEIFNCKQTRRASSMLTRKIEVKQTIRTSTDIICTCIHSEAL